VSDDEEIRRGRRRGRLIFYFVGEDERKCKQARSE
jgi:hypothetical protein